MPLNIINSFNFFTHTHTYIYIILSSTTGQEMDHFVSLPIKVKYNPINIEPKFT